jgi:hypothetical protein
MKSERSTAFSSLSLLSIAAVMFGLLAIGSAVATAQAQDVYRFHYFSNNKSSAPDAKLRIGHPGLAGGNLCAMIYVFDNDAVMEECCGCLLDRDTVRKLSVQADLTASPFNPFSPLVDGVIKVVSSSVNNTPCDPTANVKPTPNLRTWITHIEDSVGGTFPITQVEGADSPLSASELAQLQSECAFASTSRLGLGVCTCG